MIRSDLQPAFELNGNVSNISAKTVLGSSTNVDVIEGIYEEIYEEVPNVSVKKKIEAHKTLKQSIVVSSWYGNCHLSIHYGSGDCA